MKEGGYIDWKTTPPNENRFVFSNHTANLSLKSKLEIKSKTVLFLFAAYTLPTKWVWNHSFICIFCVKLTNYRCKHGSTFAWWCSKPTGYICSISIYSI